MLPGSRYVVLDGVQDPGNVGTVLRTADAFGCDGVLLLTGCADPYSVKTLRSSMGAVFRVPVWCTDAAAMRAAAHRGGAAAVRAQPCGTIPRTCGRWICAAAPSPSAARAGD